MAGPTSIAPHVATGKLRALLVTGELREPTLPSVPTVAEAGLQTRGEAWIGLVAPARTPTYVTVRMTPQHPFGVDGLAVRPAAPALKSRNRRRPLTAPVAASRSKTSTTHRAVSAR